MIRFLSKSIEIPSDFPSIERKTQKKFTTSSQISLEKPSTTFVTCILQRHGTMDAIQEGTAVKNRVWVLMKKNVPLIKPKIN
jgi:hypothetical protein